MLRVLPSVPSTPGAPAAQRPASEVIEDARYQDIARRLLQGQATAAIAAAHSLSPRQMRRVIGSERLRRVYEEVRDALYGGDAGVDEIIRDEKAQEAMRLAALNSRALTTLGEVLTSVRGHIKERGSDSRAAHLDAAVRAVRTAMEFGGPGSPARGGSTHVSVAVLNVPEHAASNIRAAAREADIDIADVLADIGGTDDVEDAVEVAAPDAAPDAEEPKEETDVAPAQ